MALMVFLCIILCISLCSCLMNSNIPCMYRYCKESCVNCVSFCERYIRLSAGKHVYADLASLCTQASDTPTKDGFHLPICIPSLPLLDQRIVINVHIG